MASTLSGFTGILGADPDIVVSGYHMLGATAPKTLKIPTRGKKGMSRAQHKKIREKALKSGQKAAATGQVGIQKASAYNKATTSKIHGDTLLGVLKTPNKPLTPKQQKAVAKLKKAQEKHANAAALLAVKGQAALIAAGGVAQTLAHQKNAIYKTAQKQPKATTIGFDPFHHLLPGQPAPKTGPYVPLQPKTPLYTTETIPYANTSPAPTFDTTSLVSDTIPSSATGSSAEKVVYQAVPPDGVVYDGDQGFPSGTSPATSGFGSWNAYYGNGDGYFWRTQKDPGKGVRAGVANTPGKWDAWQHGKITGKKQVEYGPQTFASVQKTGWGPLIGNPNNETTKGLKFAYGQQKWFWFRDDAPAWATMEEDLAAMAVQQEAEAAEAAAQEAAAAEAAQKQAAAEEAQAMKDAEAALAEETHQTEIRRTEEKAASEMQIEDARAAQEQAKLDAQQAREQVKLDAENQRAAMEIEKIRAQNEVEMARLQAQRAQYAPSGATPTYDQGGTYDAYTPQDYNQGGENAGVPEFNPQDQGSVADGSASYEDPFAGVPYPQEEE